MFILHHRPEPARRVFHSVISLRGFWALVIVWFHIGVWDQILPPGFWRYTGGFAWLGPHQFFILSGFVMTWSLWNINYSWVAYPQYLLRRMVRLDPPYFITIGLIILASYLGSLLMPGMVHGHFGLEWGRLLSHAAYATDILGQQWYNPVFWTLGIEFQFYLMLGLIYPFVVSKIAWVRWLTFGALFALYLPMWGAVQTTWMIAYLPFFMLGFLIFQYHARLIGAREYWLLTIPLLLVSMTYTPVLILYCFVTIGLLLEDRIRNPISEFFGRISYSLYLVHMPFGIPLVRIGEHFCHTDGERVLLALGVMLLCIPVAWVFYHLVELPSHKLARRVRRPGRVPQ